MYVTKEFRSTNKMRLLIEIVRIDESLATLIEHYYDDITEIENTIDFLKYQGIECEREYTGLEDYSIFDEFGVIIDELCNEIKNGDMEIHYNKRYGY